MTMDIKPINNTTTRPRFRIRWWMLALFFALAGAGLLLILHDNVANVMHPALDELSAVSISERWKHPQMLKIRDLGEEAVPPLRRVLREKNNLTVRALLWVRGKWPGATNYYSHFPDAEKMTERRWVACQVLQTLGPAGKDAAPELMAILKDSDPRDLNAASMALQAIGIDTSMCEQLNALIEKGAPPVARVHIIMALASVKPPSARTLKALTTSLTDTAPYVQIRAAQTLGQFGISTPEIISSLKKLQTTSINNLVVISASVALWDLQQDSSLVLPRVFPILEQELANFTKSSFPGSGGQGLSENEQIVITSAFLFQRMKLTESDQTKALDILDTYGRLSGRIFIRMLLLPPMMDLGFPSDKCLAVCREGLNAKEDYYRIQAARLHVELAKRHPNERIDFDGLLRDRDVNVRIHAAKGHWGENHRADAVVPVLAESLDRSKHQSYYYAETQPVALALLGEIGPEAKAAISPLEKLLSDPNPVIVGLTSNALRNIRR